MPRIGSLTGDHVVPEPNEFVAGQKAAKAFKGLEACPYVKHSHAWTRWLNGWRYQYRVMGVPEPTYKRQDVR